jgi:opacity protein-like surface antigen
MLMKKFLIVAASIFGVAGAAVAADLPVRQPPPPTPVVGKAPIGKMPIIGKLPFGKAPPPPPPPAQGAVITRG